MQVNETKRETTFRNAAGPIQTFCKIICVSSFLTFLKLAAANCLFFGTNHMIQREKRVCLRKLDKLNCDKMENMFEYDSAWLWALNSATIFNTTASVFHHFNLFVLLAKQACINVKAIKEIRIFVLFFLSSFMHTNVKKHDRNCVFTWKGAFPIRHWNTMVPILHKSALAS